MMESNAYSFIFNLNQWTRTHVQSNSLSIFIAKLLGNEQFDFHSLFLYFPSSLSPGMKMFSFQSLFNEFADRIGVYI